jgi:nicotinate phosphoribosyltransferase
VFEVFTRRLPAGRAYGVVAGMNRLIEAIGNFRFSSDVIEHLVTAGVVSAGPMTDWLANYHFRGDVTGYADGELFFPYSPVLTVEGSFAECVVLETVLLSVLNHDCAVASAAARVTDAANGLIPRRTSRQAAVMAFPPEEQPHTPSCWPTPPRSWRSKLSCEQWGPTRPIWSTPSTSSKAFVTQSR